jgi:hypothetical protein
MADGWGYPIVPDESEGESSRGGVCGTGRDRFSSGGADQVLDTADDVWGDISADGCL